MIKSLLVTSAVGALLLGGTAAQAGTLAMNGWLFAPGNNVASTRTATSAFSAKSYSGQAGGFKGKLSGIADVRFNIDPLELYCVDLDQTVYINKQNYTVNQANADFTIMSAGTVPLLTQLRLDRLSRLVSYAESSATFVDSSAESTSLQLAIWNTIYDSDDSLGAGGTFTDTSIYAAGANALLSASVNWAITKELYVLQSNGSQDQLFWIDAATPNNNQNVPEPASLALVAAALGGLALSRRRRQA